METLGNYFSYNNDYSEINPIYNELSQQLKEIHSNGKVVSDFSAGSIAYDAGSEFLAVGDPVNFEAEKRKNVVAFAKLLLGTYLSLSTGFTDFSNVDDSFFFENIDDICSSITADDFYPEYFYGVFKEGKNEYYCDFLARKQQEQALSGKQNEATYRKVLANAASSLYADNNESDDIDLTKKQASVNTLFYPILIVGTLLILGLLIVLINKFV